MLQESDSFESTLFCPLLSLTSHFFSSTSRQQLDHPLYYIYTITMVDHCYITYRLTAIRLYVHYSQLEFRQQLMQQLVEQYKQERSRKGRPPHSPQQDQPQEHWPEKVEERGDCVYCRQHENQRVRIRTRCKGCRVYLCIDPCFELHHTRK
jgi:hypothetical protein